ncbi:MAG: 2-oxoacid:acceptor oxidoreductase family protein [Oscillospiraceae bacterium]|nr:2-oxoacid:acceptor oxidoreductase family protein [Oscillospiraceae bacterium]
MTHEILAAGFGGQGVLFLGRVLAQAGLIDGKEVSWFPSYGPEMRGGTCNCSVCLSEKPIGSPLVTHPSVLIAMNTPSLEKFIDFVVPGGVVICDSTMVDTEVSRDDVKAFSIPASQLAADNDLKGGANIILIGKLIKETGVFTRETFKKAIEKIVPPEREHLIAGNLRAAEIGINS